MNKKHAGLLAMIPLLVAFIAPQFVQMAEAKPADGSPGYLKPRAYGTGTSSVVCGDKLCNESESSMVAVAKKVTHEEKIPAYMPSIESVQVTNFSGDSESTYNAIYTVTAGDKDITDVTVVVESDSDVMTFTLGGVHADQQKTTMVRINANDPMSITATIIGFALND
jgi:hypothetical protein